MSDAPDDGRPTARPAKQTARDKDRLDRVVLERALRALKAGPGG